MLSKVALTVSDLSTKQNVNFLYVFYSFSIGKRTDTGLVTLTF